MKIVTVTAFILTLIGALNWLLVGVFAFDLVAWIFGAMSIGARIVYTLVGIGGVWMLFYWALYRPMVRAKA